MNRLINLKANLSQLEDNFFIKNTQKSTINVQQFKRVIYGPNYQQRQRALSIIKQHPDVFEHYHLTEASRQHQRQQTTKQFLFLKKYLDISNPNSKSNPNKFTLFGNGFTFYDLNLTTKLGVHYSLYLKIVERLGTSARHKYYYERACNFNDLGCFALTQLLHGSNVKGLLTEAHYDHASRQIIIHTPCKEAMKFWIGGAAKTATMCAVFAQLYIGNKCHGVHTFIVPIRDPKTHKVLPGIIIGDCGPKFGLNAVDNGFLIFNKFRIPVENLLDKVSGINEKGEFVSTVDSQDKRFGMTLASLSQGRLFMCCHSTTIGLSALAIALRYTFIRQQFSTKVGEPERYLIQYPLTKRRLIPLLAHEIVNMCVTMNTFINAQNTNEKNELSPSSPFLKEIHAVSSVLKAKTAWTASQVIRQCRQVMGGHGYSAYSKMGALYANNDVNNTWQGQNYVLIQQTTRFVIQNFQKAMKGKPLASPLLKFFNNPPQDQVFTISSEFLKDFEKIKKFLMTRIFKKAQQLGLHMMGLKQKKLPFDQIWNNSQLYMGQTMSMTTGDLYMLNLCLSKLNQIKDDNSKRVFEDILHLWTLIVIKQDESVNESDHDVIEQVIMEYCEKIYPQTLGLLKHLVAGQEVLGSPFANESGEGLEKYMNFVYSRPQKQRAIYWENFVERRYE